jgi:ATP-dependent Clp protease ATP-binding subunit ClpA
MLSPKLEQTLHRALALANDRRHEYATLEHLLLALTEDQDAITVLRACNVDLDRLRGDLLEYLDGSLSNLVGNAASDAKPTAGFQRVLQRAAIHVQSSGREEVTGTNLLLALFSERESHAVFYLQEQEMSRLDAVNFVAHGLAKVRANPEVRRASRADVDAVEFSQPRPSRSGAVGFTCRDGVWAFSS